MVECRAGAASYKRLGLILCALLFVFTSLFVKPEPALGGDPPSACDIYVENCAKVTVFPAVGNGSGRIISSHEGIDCTVTAGVASGTCEYLFLFVGSSLTVTVTYTPATGSLVTAKYPGDPPIPTASSTFILTDGDTEGLYDHGFVLTRHTLSLTKTGAGTGRVTSSPTGIDCVSSCAGTFDYGTQVALTAAPDAGAVFKAWTGACAGQGATCTLTIQAATLTNVVFELPEASGGGGGGGGGGAGSGGSTIGANTGGTTGATTSSKTDKAVTASVVRTRSSKSPLGKRIVQLELNLEENVSATLTLLRGKRILLRKQLTRVRPGNRLLTLRIPKGVGKGKATLVFKLKDPAGNTLSGRRSIKIAAL